MRVPRGASSEEILNSVFCLNYPSPTRSYDEIFLYGVRPAVQPHQSEMRSYLVKAGTLYDEIIVSIPLDESVLC